MRFGKLELSRYRTGVLAAGAIFVAAVAAPVHMPVPGDLSITNTAEARTKRMKSSSMSSSQESGCDATCLNNQQLQTIQSGGTMSTGMSGGMSSGGMSGSMSSGSTMSSGMSNDSTMSPPPRTRTYRGGTGGQPRSAAEAAAKGAAVSR